MDTSDTSPQTQSSPLFDLPPELRNDIYSYALTEKNPVYIYCKQGYTNWFALGRPRGAVYWQSPPLLQTCLKIRMEASSIYYSTSQFTIVGEKSWPHHLTMWISALTPASVWSLTEVRVHSYQFEPTFNLVNDIKRFWESLQGTDRAISSDVLHMRLMVWKQAPREGVRGDLGVSQLEWLTVTRIERARIVLDAILEDDSDPTKNEAHLVHRSEVPTGSLPLPILTKLCI